MSQATISPIASDRPRGGLFSAIGNSIADLGAVIIRWVETLGDMTLFAARTIGWLLTRLPRRDTLVPAFMALAGEANWWAPRWMRRIYDRFGIHESTELDEPPLVTGPVEEEVARLVEEERARVSP